MDLGLQNKVAVVTGGTLGIGLACARALAKEGAKVVVCGRSQDKLDAAIAAAAEDGLTLYGTTADVTDMDSVKALMDWVWDTFGAMNILINNAGRPSLGPALSLNEEQWHGILDTNLNSVWNCSKAAAPYLERSGGGVILNMSSISGRIAFTHQGAYPVSKAGINALTKVMASELAAQNIRVVAVAPGFTQTELLKTKHGDTSYLADMTLLRRLAQPEDIGNLVTFLVSDAAAYITAEIFEISGGAFQVRDPNYSWDHQ